MLVKQGYAVGSAFLMTAAIVVVSIPGKYLEAYAVVEATPPETAVSTAS